MKKPLGQRAWELYDENVSTGVKRHVDGALRVGAKVTRRLRDKKAIERQGRSLTNSIRKKLHV